MTPNRRVILLQTVVLIALAVMIPTAASEECSSVGHCQCTLSNGSVIDLKSISSGSNSPRFSFLTYVNSTNKEDDTTTASETKLIFYDPCTPFDLISPYVTNSTCTNVLACMVSPSSSSEKVFASSLASLTSQVFHSDEIIYKSSSGATTLKVTLYCSSKASSPKVEVKSNSSDVELLLTSKCACPDGCKEKSPDTTSDHGLSTGSILLIIAFTLVTIYVVGGIMWNFFCLGATGVEMLPNVSFWKEFPELVVDGARFATSCCRGRSAYAGV